MDIDYDIIETPVRIMLYGFRSQLDGQAVPIVGKRLMDAMWHEVGAKALKTKGQNHWVYLPNAEMFVGVELADGSTAGHGALEACEVTMQRYLRHLHRGPYTDLHAIWPKLFEIVKSLGEHPSSPCLELYGHWNPDPNQCETTILIGLAPKQ